MTQLSLGYKTRMISEMQIVGPESIDNHIRINEEYLEKSRPAGLKWRSSSWFVTFVIGLGISVDLIVYSIIIPVMPFQLEHLGYQNVSSLAGWLLFAYSGGLVISTIPIALFSERYNVRQSPLILGLFILLGSQVMLMEAPNYAVMCVARVLQGIGSSLVWVVGLALLCDTAPPSKIGVLLGFAIGGLSIGVVIGPPVGGALYNHFGYRAPFIFSLCATFIDLIGRLVLIERKDALLWGVDPALDEARTEDSPSDVQKNNSEVEAESSQGKETTEEQPPSKRSQSAAATRNPSVTDITTTIASPKPISFLKVIGLLGRSNRAAGSFFITLIYGLVYSAQEPTIPIHMQAVWGLDSGKVGLVFIAAVVPTLFSSPATGYVADKYGAEWVAAFTMLLSLPWWVTLIVEKQLVLFIVVFAIESLFTTGVISPVTAELAAVARDIDGIGYAHVYGAFNFIYGIGTSVGPVVGGQIYDHVNRGWMVLCLLSAALLFICVLVAVAVVGSRPLLHRFLRKKQASSDVS